jgi:hypothetical protein
VNPNMRILENPYLLKDLDEDLDPFLSELIEWDPPDLQKDKSVPALSMLFEGASKATDDHQTTAMTRETMDLLEEGDLLTKSPMATYRIISPSPRPSKPELWDPCPESSTETELEPRPSSPNSSDTWC